MNFLLRKARLDERPALEKLIALSARGLSRDDYSDAEIEAAIAHVFGVDTDLIHDQTYFVAERDGTLIGCGGWSKRKTLFGGDNFGAREGGWLDPQTDAAKIRAFFVHPDWARRGVGRAIIEACEAEARAAGFVALEMMATLPGVKMYRALGYTGDARVSYMAGSVPLEFVPMRKKLV